MRFSGFAHAWRRGFCTLVHSFRMFSLQYWPKNLAIVPFSFQHKCTNCTRLAKYESWGTYQEVELSEKVEVSSQIFHIFSGKNVSGLTIVEQCRYCAADFTGDILTSPVSWRQMQKRILMQTRSSDFNIPASTSLSSTSLPSTLSHCG